MRTSQRSIPAILFLFAPLVLLAQQPPVQRQAWTTNAPWPHDARGSNITFLRSDAYHDPFQVYSSNSANTTFLVSSNGNVGIFTNVPAARLHVNGSLMAEGPITNVTGNNHFMGGTTYFNDGVQVGITTPGTIEAYWDTIFRGNGALLTNIPSTALTGSISGSIALDPNFTNVNVYQSDAYHVPLNVWANDPARPGLTVNSNGYVGILTNVPGSALDLFGTETITRYAAGINQYLKFHLAKLKAANDQMSIFWYTDTHVSPDFVGKLAFTLQGSTTDSNKQFQYFIADINTPKMVVAGSGNVGIGTNYPQSRLHVVNLAANSDPGIDLSNDANTWRMRVYGTENDQWELVDWDATPAVAMGAAIDGGPVWIPGGLHSTNSIATTVLGYLAASGSQASNGLCLGRRSGYNALWCSGLTSIGESCFDTSTNNYDAVGLGRYSGYLATNCPGSYFLGYNSGRLGLDSPNCQMFGYSSGYGLRGSIYTTAIGYSASSYSSNIDYTTSIGYYAGSQNTNAINSVFIGKWAGTNCNRDNTLIIDYAGKTTNSLIYGEFDNNLVRINTNLDVEGGLTISVPTNGVAPPPMVEQSQGLFSQLAYQSTNSLDMVYEAYTNVITGTTYDDVLTNGFYANPAIGTLTNVYAGFWMVQYSLSVLSDANVNGDELEAEVFFDGVGDEHTASLITADSATGFYSLSKSHIKYLPANTRIEIKMKNVSDPDQDFNVSRIVFIVKSP